MDNSLYLSTDSVPAEVRAGTWRRWLDELFGGLDTDLYGARDFEGHVRTARAGDVIISRMEAGRHRVMRTERQARASTQDWLKIVAPLQGSAVVEQHGRQAWVTPGSWAIYDTTGHYEVANPEPSLHLIVLLPRCRLAEHGLRLQPLMGRCIGGHQGISRVTLETLRTTFQELPAMPPQTARGAGELVLEMVRLSLLDLEGTCPKPSLQATFKDRIRSLVGQHLRDPELDLDRLAQLLNCSKRHLHKAFADEDETLSRYILSQRLQACMRELRTAEHRDRTITDIAFSWGFSSGAHFSRVFREHTGQSPSDWREQPPPH
jgi:AraC-like DNA-binding protein